MSALYVPPTDEADHKKQNQSLQLIGGVTSTNTTNIATNTANITTNTTNITTNTTSITNLQRSGISIYDFGAVGDGVTNDTTAFQNAVTYCVANKRPLELGNGNFATTTAISITGALTLLGNGIFETKVLPSSTINCFNINTAEAVVMRDFQITYLVTPLSGSNLVAIQVTAPTGENSYSRFSNLFIGNPYIGFSFVKASLFSIEGGTYINTSLSATGAIGVIVDNQNLIDSGDSVITDTTFLGAAPGGGVTTVGLSWVGSGGLRVTNCKFNGQTTAMLAVLPSAKATGDLFVFNNSFENLTTGFSFSAGAASSFNFIQISNNEIWAVNPVIVNGSGSTFLRGVVVTGNTLKFDNTAYGVRLIGVQNFTISGNAFYSLVAGATGINVDSASDGAIGVNSYNTNVATHVTNSSTAVQQVGELLLATYTMSSAASVSDIINLTSAYRGFRIVGHNLIPATNGVNLQFQVYESGSFVTAGYVNAAGGATTYIDLFPGTTVANTALYGWSGSVEIGEASSSSHARYIVGRAVVGTSAPTMTYLNIAGFHNASTAVSGFKIAFSSGNIASGVIQVFGIP